MLHGPVVLVLISCGIRLTTLELMTDSCSLPEHSKKLVSGLQVQLSGPFRKGTSFSRMLLHGPFRTTVNFDNSVTKGPTSVSHYKRTLSNNPLVHAKCQVAISISYQVTCFQFHLWFLKGPSFRSQCLEWSHGKSIQRWTGEQPTRWQPGGSSSDG